MPVKRKALGGLATNMASASAPSASTTTVRGSAGDVDDIEGMTPAPQLLSENAALKLSDCGLGGQGLGLKQLAQGRILAGGPMPSRYAIAAASEAASSLPRATHESGRGRQGAKPTFAIFADDVGAGGDPGLGDAGGASFGLFTGGNREGQGAAEGEIGADLLAFLGGGRGK
jgi:hypothetical protein